MVSFPQLSCTLMVIFLHKFNSNGIISSQVSSNDIISWHILRALYRAKRKIDNLFVVEVYAKSCCHKVNLFIGKNCGACCCWETRSIVIGLILPCTCQTFSVPTSTVSRTNRELVRSTKMVFFRVFFTYFHRSLVIFYSRDHTFEFHIALPIYSCPLSSQ